MGNFNIENVQVQVQAKCKDHFFVGAFLGFGWYLKKTNKHLSQLY